MFSMEKAEIYRYGLVGLLVFSQVFVSPNRAWAQANNIQADPSFSTQVEVNPNSIIIRGGFPGDNNLFHRFSTFNIVNGQLVSFANDFASKNIFAQVLDEASFIDGIIESQGANLYLINPNGIVFGPNAELAVNGSFVATTADSVTFATLNGDEVVFNRSSRPGELEFAMDPSALLFTAASNQTKPFSIISEATIEVPDGQSIIFIGGSAFPSNNFQGGILLNDGALVAPGGRIYLGAVQGRSTVDLEFEDGILSVNSFTGQLADIQLINDAEVIVRDFGNGDIFVSAQNLNLEGGSQLIAGIAPGQGEFNKKAGDIEIFVTETLTLRGVETFLERSAIINALGIQDALLSARGQGGNIYIQAAKVQILEGGQIFASTFEEGDAGSIFIEANEVHFAGGLFDPNNGFIPSQAFNRAEIDSPANTNARTSGNAGLIQITTNLLSLSNGGRISTSTRDAGNAGKIVVIATNGQVLVDGVAESPSPGFDDVQSGLFSEVLDSAAGIGGDITIQTSEIRVTNGARVSATSFSTGRAGTLNLSASELVRVTGEGSEISFDSRSVEEDGGKAGNLVVVTPQLELLRGGQISARTAGGGDAGTINVEASESIFIDGNGSGLFFDTEGSGNAQGIEITTGSLTVQNQGEITVSGTGMGNPGNLEISADDIYLNQEGKLRAITLSGTGGNIAPLNVGNLLFMTDGSQITASAEGPGDGGNIEILAPNGFIISRSLDENNDVLASAIEGRGGRARATAIAVLGFQEFVGEPTPRSDFTASSVLNIDDGETIIDEQEREFEEIPLELLDAQIARNCRLERPADQSEFVITGRGGIPATPAEMMNIGDPEVELVVPNGEADHSVQPSQGSSSIGLDRNETNRVEAIDIVEPQGWVYNDNGDIVLVAYNPEVTPPSSTIPTVNCLSQNAISHSLYQTPGE